MRTSSPRPSPLLLGAVDKLARDSVVGIGAGGGRVKGGDGQAVARRLGEADAPRDDGLEDEHLRKARLRQRLRGNIRVLRGVNECMHVDAALGGVAVVFELESMMVVCIISQRGVVGRWSQRGQTQRRALEIDKCLKSRRRLGGLNSRGQATICEIGHCCCCAPPCSSRSTPSQSQV